MTNQERDAIWARWDKAVWYGKDSVFASSMQDILILLDALDEYESDRDQWKARAEALERAIKQYSKDEDEDNLDILCCTCEFYAENDGNYVMAMEKCERCDDNYSEWQFNEARF